MRTLVLASQSPRRKELLEKAGFDFETLMVKVSEILKENLSWDEALIDIARTKAQSAMQSVKPIESKDILLLCADTMVLCDERPLGKPSDFSQAKQYLGLLSGKTHTVKTAVVCVEPDTGREASGVDTTYVTFHPLTEQQIDSYIFEKKPLDKAGAYGLQELPEGFVKSVKGEFDNVVGLPIKLVEKLLKENNWHVRRRTTR